MRRISRFANGRLVRVQSSGDGVRSAAELTKMRLYSLSNRCKRFVGSFAASTLRLLEGESEVPARRRDHCSIKGQQGGEAIASRQARRGAPALTKSMVSSPQAFPAGRGRGSVAHRIEAVGVWHSAVHVVQECRQRWSVGRWRLRNRQLLLRGR